MSPNSRASIDIKMKLGPVTKLDERNLPTSEKFSDDVMSVNCDVIVTFSIYGLFGAKQSGSWILERMVCKTYIFIKSYLLSYKN